MLNLRKQFRRLIILSYALIMMYVVFSGLISKFVHPRMIPYIVTCGIILLIFFVIDIFNKKAVINDKFNKSDIIYIFPLILMLFINNGDLSANAISNKGINIGKSSIENIQSNDFNNALKIAAQMDKAEAANKVVEVKNIEVNNKNYIETLMNMSDTLDSFVGSEISIDGFIFRDKTMKSNEFVIGRLAITCCTADAQLIGYLCKYDGDCSTIIDHNWYNVKAKIETIVQDGVLLPYFNIEKIIEIDKPTDEYIY